MILNHREVPDHPRRERSRLTLLTCQKLFAPTRHIRDEPYPAYLTKEPTMSESLGATVATPAWPIVRIQPSIADIGGDG